jgi:hypothetical protein
MENLLQNILIENFRECLRIYERCVVWALAASFSFLLFTLRLLGAAPNQIPTTRIPVLFADLPLRVAWYIALGLYVLFGAFACLAIERAFVLIQKFSEEPKIAVALTLYPSVATQDARLIRLGAVLLPPIFALSAFALEMYREVGPSGSWLHQPWLGLLMLLALMLMPYGYLVYCAKDPIRAVPKQTSSPSRVG